MKNRFVGIVSVMALMTLSCIAHADDVSKRAKIEDLLLTTKANQTYDAMAKQGMENGVRAALNTLGPSLQLTDEDKKSLAKFQDKLYAALMERLGWETMKPDLVKLYADTYSEDEIDGMLAFYKSPVGQSLLAKSPSIIKKSSDIVLAHTKDFGTVARPLMLEFQQEIAQAHPKPTAPAATPASPASTTASPAAPSTAPSIPNSSAPKK